MSAADFIKTCLADGLEQQYRARQYPSCTPCDAPREQISCLAGREPALDNAPASSGLN